MGQATSFSNTSVNKLNLAAPPPPPPPDEKVSSHQNLPGKSGRGRGRGGGDFSNYGHRGRGSGNVNNQTSGNFNRGRESNNFIGNRGNRGTFENGNNRGRGNQNQKGTHYQARRFGGGYNHHFEDNTEYDDQGNDDMDLENNSEDHQDYQEENVPFLRDPDVSRSQSDGIVSSASSIRPGGETLDNFDKMFDNWERTYGTWREENRHNPNREYVRAYTEQMEAMRENLREKRRKIERSQDMFRSWKSVSGAVNIPGIDPEKVSNARSEQRCDSQPPSSDVVNSILGDNDYDDSGDEKEEPKQEERVKKSRWGDDDQESSNQPRLKKSRWENDPEDNIDIDQMRRRPESSRQHQNFQPRPFPGPQRPAAALFPSHGVPMSKRGRGSAFGHHSRFPQNPNFTQQERPVEDFEEFWKPSEVKDYSRNRNHGDRFSLERDFRPQTFDYSHGSQERGGRTGRQDQGRFNNTPSPAPAKPLGACVMIDSVLAAEGRMSRPPKIVIILRGVPGSGKSHLAKLIKDRELEAGGDQMRTMCLDDYFDVDGIYEYDSEMEESYRASFLKSFKKTVDGNLFSFILVDAVHNKVSQFREFWSYAKQNGFEVNFFMKVFTYNLFLFEVYVCSVDCDTHLAASRNIHKRTEEEVVQLSKSFEETPGARFLFVLSFNGSVKVT